MDRNYLEGLILRNQMRFTQDSPILPDVWLAYGLDPKQPHELLLTPHIEARTARVTVLLRKALVGADTPPAIAGIHFNICGTIHFEDLIRHVLPMTSWWQEEIYPLFQGEGDKRSLRWSRTRITRALNAFEKGEQPSDEIPIHLLWLLRLVGTIAAAHAGKRAAPKTDPHEYRAKTVVDALFDLVGMTWRQCMRTPITEHLWLINCNRDAATSISRSSKTIKADAAIRLFNISSKDLTWAVLDSGIDAEHPAFQRNGSSRVRATYDFNRIRELLDPNNLDPNNEILPAYLRKLIDEDDAVLEELEELKRHLSLGREIDWDILEPFLRINHRKGYAPPEDAHGTHVAGILAAGEWDGGSAGICPDIKLYDFRVLDEKGRGSEFSVIAALQFIEHLNAHRDYKLIHGANLSLSIPHDVVNYACGRTPVCEQCNRLVSAGVVVTVAAGNAGYVRFKTDRGDMEGYNSISITDPGNADKVITVGSTHRHQPHTYGVSYFSSRGPTGDGRIKPDLVAPGEKITAPTPGQGYAAKDGTSMAAPHVSGAAALLLARYPELIGQPDRVKGILCQTATDLGRERYFQGHGMVDVLRALQSI